MNINRSDRYTVLATFRHYGYDHNGDSTGVMHSSIAWIDANMNRCHDRQIVSYDDVVRFIDNMKSVKDAGAAHLEISRLDIYKDGLPSDIYDFVVPNRPMKEQAKLNMFVATQLFPLVDPRSLILFTDEDWLIAPNAFVHINELIATLPDPAPKNDRADDHEYFDFMFCECDDCGESVHIDTMDHMPKYGDNHYVCDDCADNYRMCDHCGELTHSDDLGDVRTSSHARRSVEYCEDCRDEHSFTCDGCNDIFHNDICITSDRGDCCCETCYSETFSRCEDCGCELTDDESFYDDGSVYCESRLPDSGSDHIHSYGTNVSHHCKPMGKPKDHIYFGVELEVGSDDIDDADMTIDALGSDFAILKEDSGVEGFEIVSTRATLDIHRDRWEQFFDQCSFMQVDQEYGMHVHVSRKPLGNLTIGKLLVFINDPDSSEFLNALAERKPNGYCERDKKKITDVKKHQCRDALNLNNANTIEFRLFRTCDNYQSFMQKLEFVHALVYWAQNASIRDLSYQSFCEYARKYRKIYPHLNAFIKAY